MQELSRAVNEGGREGEVQSLLLRSRTRTRTREAPGLCQAGAPGQECHSEDVPGVKSQLSLSCSLPDLGTWRASALSTQSSADGEAGRG